MTITVSGQTYNYREALKGMGGKFDGSTKTWSFPDSLSPRDLNYIKQMVGVYVSKSAQPETPEQTFDRLASRTVERSGPIKIYGDDQTYLNYFAEKNPITFFGFSNLNAFVTYVENARPNPNHAAWAPEQNSFHGSYNMAQAIRYARDGWKEGIEKAKEILEYLNTDHAQMRKRSYGVAGGRVNVGRMISGNPLNMVYRPKQPGTKRITIFVETAINSVIAAKNAAIRAACIAAIVDILEIQGYSLTIVATNIAVASMFRRTPIQQLAVTIKEAGEKLNLNDLIFALGHPSFERRFNFACVSSSPDLREWHESCGAASSAFNDLYPCTKGEYYIPQFTKGIQSQIRGETLRERALSLLPHIIPEGLPIEVKL